MLNLLKLALALCVGVVLGSLVNMGIVVVGPKLIPPPPGAVMTTVEGLVAAMPLLQPKHFVAPFLAHALGTLVGATVVALLAISHRAVLAYTVGALFLIGGIMAAQMIPAPVWFIALDLLVAYIPMAWLGLGIANRLRSRPGNGVA